MSAMASAAADAPELCTASPGAEAAALAALEADLARELRLETMIAVRKTCDDAEAVCPAGLWTLATYKELLFLDQTLDANGAASTY